MKMLLRTASAICILSVLLSPLAWAEERLEYRSGSWKADYVVQISSSLGTNASNLRTTQVLQFNAGITCADGEFTITVLGFSTKGTGSPFGQVANSSCRISGRFHDLLGNFDTISAPTFDIPDQPKMTDAERQEAEAYLKSSVALAAELCLPILPPVERMPGTSWIAKTRSWPFDVAKDLQFPFEIYTRVVPAAENGPGCAVFSGFSSRISSKEVNDAFGTKDMPLNRKQWTARFVFYKQEKVIESAEIDYAQESNEKPSEKEKIGGMSVHTTYNEFHVVASRLGAKGTEINTMKNDEPANAYAPSEKRKQQGNATQP